jgi:uncharacterized protein YndB with AHSA1/START domain
MPARAGNAAAAKPNERTVTITRAFDAPRDRVFKAWTDAGRIAQWWAPKGFAIPVCEADPRPGGAFRLCMRWAERGDYRMRGHYAEIVAPERIVIRGVASDAEDRPRLEAIIDVTFAEQGSGTTMTVTTTARGSGEIAAAMLDGMEEGWNQTIDHLGLHLAQHC